MVKKRAMEPHRGKVLFFKRFLKDEEQATAKKEAEVLHQMQHSNITMYVESFVENSKLFIVMEYADGGDLSYTIGKRKKINSLFPENELMRIFVQICLALKHVHDHNILWRRPGASCCRRSAGSGGDTHTTHILPKAIRPYARWH